MNIIKPEVPLVVKVTTIVPIENGDRIKEILIMPVVALIAEDTKLTPYVVWEDSLMSPEQIEAVHASDDDDTICYCNLEYQKNDQEDEYTIITKEKK